MTSVAAHWNAKMDALLAAADGCKDDCEIVRRSCMDAKLRSQGLIIQERSMIAAIIDRCRFFEHGAMKGWLEKVFPGHSTDVEERMLRTLEEVLELAQVEEVTREQMHALVDQVMDKPVGDRPQELGGVMVTLASYCAVTGQDAGAAFNREFERCNDPDVIVKIQRKHAGKLVVSSKIRS